MKSFKYILALLLFSAPLAHGVLFETDRALAPFRNLLTNPGWESGTAGWTKTGSDVYVTALGGEAGSEGQWTPHDLGNTLSGSSISVPAGLQGRNGVFSCLVKLTGVGVPVAMQATQSGSVIAGSPIATTTATWSSGVNIITVGSATGISTGMTVIANISSTGLPTAATVTNISGTTITISANTSAPQLSSTEVSFYLASAQGIANGDGNFHRVNVNFIFPSSGSIVPQFVGLENANTVELDSCFVGAAEGFNLSQISQAQSFGTINYSNNAGCIWSNTTVDTAYHNYSAASACTVTTTGNATSPGTLVPGIKFASMPPGTYLFYVNSGSFSIGGFTSGESFCRWQFNDGTNSFGVIGAGDRSTSNAGATNYALMGQLVYSTTQSNVTVQIQYNLNRSDSTSNCTIDARSTLPPTPAMEIDVVYIPSSNRAAGSVSTVAASWSGYHSDLCGWTRTNTALGDTSSGGGSCTLTQVTNRNFGTVVTEATGLPGITFTPPSVGEYLVTATVPISSSISNQLYAQLTDGTTAIGQAQGFGTGIQTLTLQGIYNVVSLSPVTIKVQTGSNGGTASIAGTSAIASSINWSVVKVEHGIPTPVILNSVTSASSGVEVVNRLVFGGTGGTQASPVNCTTSPCTIISQSGSWVSSTTRTSTGVYVVNLSPGAFSSTPSCMLGSHRDNVIVPNVSAASSTTINLTSYLSNSGGTAADGQFTLFCMGPK